jgi:hypothetical protein
MKTLLTLLLAAFCAATGYGQTMKSLMFNTTNGQVVYSGTNTLTFTNGVGFTEGSAAATRTNLGLSKFFVTQDDIAVVMGETTNPALLVDGDTLFVPNAITFGSSAIAATRTNLGLGGGITATNTFVSYNGTNYTTNSVSISNGVITGWTQ